MPKEDKKERTGGPRRDGDGVGRDMTGEVPLGLESQRIRSKISGREARGVGGSRGRE